MSYTLTIVGNKPPSSTDTEDQFETAIEDAARSFVAGLEGASHAIADFGSKGQVNLIQEPAPAEAEPMAEEATPSV